MTSWLILRTNFRYSRIRGRGMTGLGRRIEEAIKAHWGDRCPDFGPDCPTCQAWAEYDALRTARAIALEEAAKVARKNGWGVTALDILALKEKKP